MRKLPGDKTVGQFGELELVVAVIEQVLSIFVEQRLVTVHARAIDTEDGFGHEGRHQTVLGGDGLHRVFQGQHVIR